MLRKTLIFLSESEAAKAVVTRTPLRHMSKRFVPGEEITDFLRAAGEANTVGLEVTGNYLGEAEHDERTARDSVQAYMKILDGIVKGGLKGNISVKPTQVGLEIGKEFFKENLRPLLDRAKEAGVFVRWDMESSEWTQATLDPFEEMWAEGYQNMGVVLQSYMRRTMDDARRMNELGVRVRLCKGAYVEPPEVAYQDKKDVDRNFVEVSKLLLTDELGEEDEDDVPRPRGGRAPAVRLPRGTQPDVAGDERAYEVLEVPFLGSIEDDADFGPGVHIDLERGFFGVEVALRIDGGCRGEAVIVPLCAGEGIAADVGDRVP